MSPFSSLFGGHISTREIEKLVDRLDIAPAGNLARVSREDLRVAVIQLFCKQYKTLADYIVDMNLYITDAVNKRAQLVCFPAYAGLLPATFIPQFTTVMPRLRQTAATGMPDIKELNDTLSYFSDYIFDAYFNTMSALAARHGIYVMAGSTLYFEKDDLRHRAFLFDNTGNLVGFQDKISLNRLERELAVTPAAELKTFETVLGNIAILTCEDANYFEPAKVAKAFGAKLLLSPSVFLSEQTPVDTAMGLNMRVQENYVYGARSVLIGDTGLGFYTEGYGCCFSPNDMLMRKNGVLEQTSGRYEPDIVCARFNLEKLEAGSPYTGDKNPELMHKYIDRLY